MKDHSGRKEGSMASKEGRRSKEGRKGRKLDKRRRSKLKEESRSYGAKNGIHQITIRIPLRTINF